MKESRGCTGCILVAIAVPLITFISWLAVIVRPERLALEEKLKTQFAAQYGGEPKFIEGDSKHSTWNYFLETFQGPRAYYIRLSYTDDEYHAYVEKTLDWGIQPVKKRSEGSEQ